MIDLPKPVKSLEALLPPWEHLTDAERTIVLRSIRAERQRPLKAATSPKKARSVRRDRTKAKDKVRALLDKLPPEQRAAMLEQMEKSLK